MLVGKIWQPQYKSNGKKVLKAYNSQTKSDRHKVLIKKKLAFCPALSGSINNFEFSLKHFDDVITMNSSTV